MFQYEVESICLNSKRPYRTMTGCYSSLEKAQNSRKELRWLPNLQTYQWHAISGNINDNTVVYHIITETITDEHMRLLLSVSDGRWHRLEYARGIIVNDLVNAGLLSMENSFGWIYRITSKGKIISNRVHDDGTLICTPTR